MSLILLTSGCSSQKNTAKSRWWQAFNTRYNVYYNGTLAYIEGSDAQISGNKDDFTEIIPLYIVGNKETQTLGKSNYETAILKSEKAIKLHSIKKKPVWTKNRRKTQKDIEWLNRKEYNPFLWNAWLMMGKSQFQSGSFDEAAATFSYMSRLYSTQPAIYCLSRAWLAKCYVELDWLYDAEDVMTKMKRDSIHYKAAKEWDYTYADYYIRSEQYEEAIPYLRKVIKHEKKRKLKARQWYLMGQLQAALGNKTAAYKSYKRVTRLSPPYQLAFNARISQTEVMAGSAPKKMIRKLKRMAASDNNKDYLDQVYYALGNIYLNEKDTLKAIESYEKGNSSSTRNGVEKGVLLLRLGNIYWDMERYNDAQRCYGEAIGLLDKERDYYEELSERSKVLDELVPFTDAIHLQDSLQVLAKMSEEDRNAAIDRVIEALIKKEEEEAKAAALAEAEAQAQQNAAEGNTMGTAETTTTETTSGTWYFYNPTAVSQGKASFQRLWGKRENTDDWQRVNRTVVNLNADSEDDEDEDEEEETEIDELAADSISKATAEMDSAINDPHKREYYLAQIPFTEEQIAESNNIIKDGLFNSGVIFKDKLGNLPLSERQLLRLTGQYPDYEKNDEAYYHLFLLYSRLGDNIAANSCLDTLKRVYPYSDWTVLLSDPYFAENAKFGVHIEDSLYASTYDAFKADRYDEVDANARLSKERFPLGAHRPKFLFISGLSQLNAGRADSCVTLLREVVTKYPKSEVADMAGMIVKGVLEGRTLHGGRFDLGDVWSRRSLSAELGDSVTEDTLRFERNTSYVFLLAFSPDSLDANQLLFDIAKYNFTNFMVRNFDMSTDSDNGIYRLMFRGFLNYDEALQYARRLYSDKAMAAKLKGCRRIIISDENLRLLGTKYSYRDYEEFFDNSLAPIEISEEHLLNFPEEITAPINPEDVIDEEENDEDEPYVDDYFINMPRPTNRGNLQQEQLDQLFNDAASPKRQQNSTQGGQQDDMFGSEAPMEYTQPKQSQQTNDDPFGEEAPMEEAKPEEPTQTNDDLFEEKAPMEESQPEEFRQTSNDLFGEETPVTEEEIQPQSSFSGDDLFGDEAPDSEEYEEEGVNKTEDIQFDDDFYR